MVPHSKENFNIKIDLTHSLFSWSINIPSRFFLHLTEKVIDRFFSILYDWVLLFIFVSYSFVYSLLSILSPFILAHHSPSQQLSLKICSNNFEYVVFIVYISTLLKIKEKRSDQVVLVTVSSMHAFYRDLIIFK